MSNPEKFQPSADSSNIVAQSYTKLQTKLQATKKNTPCPVCDDVSGKCRTNQEDFVLCMTYVGTPKKEIVNGWVSRGDNKSGLWGMFALELDNTDTTHITYIKNKNNTENTNNASKLSPQERHEQYTRLLAELTLHPDDYKDLQRRGFTEAEIELMGFKSVEKWHQLQGSYSAELPGLNGTNQLLVPDTGYLIPVRNIDGLIPGMQLRRRNAKNNRYIWLSSKERSSVHMKISDRYELPLAIYKPDNPVGIAIAEGTGCKPFYLASRLNYLTIGAAGGQHAGSANQLIEIINQNKNLPITIFPDANWLLDVNVRNRLLNTIELIKSKFPEIIILVADWNQLSKKQPDIDEIDRNIRYLNLDAWNKKYKEGLKLTNGFQNWIKTSTELTADIIQHERYLHIPDNIDCDILIVRKKKNGGKTVGVIDYLKNQFAQIENSSLIGILIGYRNSLIKQTLSRANEKGLKAISAKDLFEKIEGTEINHSLDESIKMVGACADSFKKLQDVCRNRHYVVIDEICSVVKHLINGGTLGKNKQEAINSVISMITESERTILLDADLNDEMVNLIRKLFPNKKIKVLDSLHEIEPKTFYFLETVAGTSEKYSNLEIYSEYSSYGKYLPANLMAILRRHVAGGKNIIWVSDSQKSCEIAEEMLLKEFENIKIYRLDGKTSAEDIAKVFLDHPDKFIESEKINVLILSPSAESGLSIDIKNHFSALCVDIKGVGDVNSLSQQMARLRDYNVPIYVSCPEFVNFESNQQPYTALPSVMRYTEFKI